ncbi:MAG: hypothetical protein ACK4NR_06290 [Micavibrio sp.]
MAITSRQTEKRYVLAAFFVALALNSAVWWQARSMRAVWGNVPPVPTQPAAELFALGDPQFAYRSFSLLIQNLGDAGGQARALKEYNYEHLTKWFFLLDKLDPHANFGPSIAAFYFSANQDVEAIDPLIDYLAEVGVRPEPQKWRWLAQAVYLARFVQHDYAKALGLAEKLAALNYEHMPTWTKQMPAFVMMQMGDKEGAYNIMLNILGSEAKDLQAAEVNFMREYICTRILSREQRGKDPLCQDMPQQE